MIADYPDIDGKDIRCYWEPLEKKELANIMTFITCHYKLHQIQFQSLAIAIAFIVDASPALKPCSMSILHKDVHSHRGQRVEAGLMRTMVTTHHDLEMIRRRGGDDKHVHPDR